METAIELIIDSKERALIEDFRVRRVLPSAKRRMVGPFIFVDQMGPEILSAGRGLDVAPHPHIGLATVTYLFAGELVHRDSIGSIRTIRPGEVNWMTAGRGIAHSERTPASSRTGGAELFGIQTWVALPEQAEETAPTFFHHAAGELPFFEDGGQRILLIAGSLFDKTSPVETFSETIYADVLLENEARFSIPTDAEERALYIVTGAIETEMQTYSAGQLLVLRPNAEVILKSVVGSSRLILLGGEPLGKRHIWWNFVSSSRERIEQAKEDWKNQKFERVIDELEYIPLPGSTGKMIVRYP